jgi:hypothetical protein
MDDLLLMVAEPDTAEHPTGFLQAHHAILQWSVREQANQARRQLETATYAHIIRLAICQLETT